MIKQKILNIAIALTVAFSVIGCSDRNTDFAGVYGCTSGNFGDIVYTLVEDGNWNMKGGNPNFVNSGTWTSDDYTISLKEAGSDSIKILQFDEKPSNWKDGERGQYWGQYEHWHANGKNCYKKAGKNINVTIPKCNDTITTAEVLKISKDFLKSQLGEKDASEISISLENIETQQNSSEHDYYCKAILIGAQEDITKKIPIAYTSKIDYYTEEGYEIKASFPRIR